MTVQFAVECVSSLVWNTHLSLGFVKHGQGALLHSQICLDIVMRSDRTLMTEPKGYDTDVDPSLQ